jgi:excisionase family DNA binding protein
MSAQPKAVPEVATAHELLMSASASATSVANDEHPIADVLVVDDVARLLRVGRNAVYDLVARNAIPHCRLGKHIRFSRAAVMQWLSSWSSRGAKERR